ncbi:APC family permease [Sphingosinicella soli]|uniref:APA family basic amino acid/polyamine antiporter n=1 Tax=Sphingosinicella soli TaxID=333708 RepID=A0A7W7F9H9_9SPHN|nr:amino acid permease [Sphingosinicella soli]MBB4632663.1 APA family basic amino acid/polyamine antiporter [Sphingosinicella soli]
MARAPIRYLIRKPLADVRGDMDRHGLHRVLGPVHLVLIGIGCIIGAGVYVMTGTAAANYAGPAVMLSFVIAGLACAFTGLCYAELASTLPVSGASYSYAYAALGEAFAWGLGWMLMLELGLAGSALAVGVSGYLASLLGDFGVHIPAVISTPFIRPEAGEAGMRFVTGGGINLVATAALLFFAFILVRGVSQSATINAVMVTVKVGVLIAFIIFGLPHVDPANWRPFVPENEGGFTYGWQGVLRGASILFFAYLGFEAVATAALEAKTPQRDIPIGILGALAIATVVYMAVAAVLTGLVSYKTLNVPDPVAVAVAAIGMPVLSVVIKAGALTGLCSVLMVNTYAHSRVCYAMSTDGLLPPLFSRIHTRFRTPHQGTWFVAGVAGVAAAFLPISILGDLVSLGTGLVFITVAISVIWLRTTQPELPRPFRVPLGGLRIGGIWFGVVPVLALLFCLLMIGPVVLDIIHKAMIGEWVPAGILGVYLCFGIAFYLLYGVRHSRLRRSLSEA